MAGLQDYQKELDNEPLSPMAEVYINIDADRNVPKNELRRRISKKRILRKLLLEKTFDSISRYFATFGIKTIAEGDKIKEELKSVEGVIGCDIEAYYTPEGKGEG